MVDSSEKSTVYSISTSTCVVAVEVPSIGAVHTTAQYVSEGFDPCAVFCAPDVNGSIPRCFLVSYDPASVLTDNDPVKGANKVVFPRDCSIKVVAEPDVELSSSSVRPAYIPVDAASEM